MRVPGRISEPEGKYCESANNCLLKTVSICSSPDRVSVLESTRMSSATPAS